MQQENCFKRNSATYTNSLSNGATAQGGPRPRLGVSSILPGLGRLLSNFYNLASLHLPPLHLSNAVWVSLWGVFLLAHWEELSWIIIILAYDMSCPSQSTQLAEFHNVILTTLLIKFLIISDSPGFMYYNINFCVCWGSVEWGAMNSIQSLLFYKYFF